MILTADEYDEALTELGVTHEDGTMTLGALRARDRLMAHDATMRRLMKRAAASTSGSLKADIERAVR